ncbi:MAG: efflux RND transporter periplasmic adaptor subunit [wastewater metagenome]|nr:efflux RND transporter periplasmic adaptor subunit [Candidatus Loosdrechtia aerotolerans]
MANEDISKLKIDKSGTRYYRSKRRRLPLWITVFILILIIGLIIYRFVINPTIEIEVSTVSQVYPSQVITLLNASGYVVAQRKASVASKITGQLEWLGVEEGSYVKEGQIIARLEGKDAIAARDQAMANLQNALSNLEAAKVEMEDAELHYNRLKELLPHGIISQSEFDIAQARYHRAQASFTAAQSLVNASRAALRSATVAVQYTIIRAPFDAVVLTKNADIGDIITPIGAAATAKAAVVTIADMDSLLVEVDVSESSIQKVQIGQPCEIQLDAFPETRFRGIVHTVVPTADRSKATVMTKVGFLDKDDRTLPEMSAKVAFLERTLEPEERKPITAVNVHAVVVQDDKKFIFLVHGNRVTKTTIIPGTRLDNMIEVLEGAKPGDRVVINPPETLQNGSKIKVKEL